MTFASDRSFSSRKESWGENPYFFPSDSACATKAGFITVPWRQPIGMTERDTCTPAACSDAVAI